MYWRSDGRGVRRPEDILLSMGKVGKEVVERARALRRSKGGGMGRILVEELKAIGWEDWRQVEERWIEILASQERTRRSIIPHIPPPQQDLLGLVPEEIARRYVVFPVAMAENKLFLAMFDPNDIFAIRDVEARAGKGVIPVIAPETEIERAIDRYYATKLTQAMVEELGIGMEAEEEEEEGDVETTVSSSPIVRLVDEIIATAIKMGASDIHIETYEKEMRIRYRIDGVLREPPGIGELVRRSYRNRRAILARIKIISNMDISERRVPQDGRIKFRVDGTDYDIRSSTLPTIHGEKAVLRIMDKKVRTLEELGFLPDMLEEWREQIRKPYGMILVTGPTGSGKTSTLYGSLMEIATPDKNVITVENPVERVIRGINQVQINEKAGLTFANVLRSILRQDPDIIMVGEIRDKETAEIAIEAALTGHLVLTTLHTNDAPGALPRLIDMGIEPFLVSSAVICVLAQRLIRLVCPRCSRQYSPSKEMVEDYGIAPDARLRKANPSGCVSCVGGYSGRRGIYELMVMNDEISKAVLAREPVDRIRQIAVKCGMRTLREDGIRKAVEGWTTLEEVIAKTIT
jgi:type IV pilus assembly protein PilB